MQPTMKLRFVKRELKATHPMMNALAPKQHQTILQQWWEDTTMDVYPAHGEWRDVPIEEES